MLCLNFSVVISSVLILVSTLATCTKALPTDQPAFRHECGDNSLCDIKPADYPQEEIDRAVLKKLPYLRRMKRSTEELARPVSGGNCEFESKTITPFIMRPSVENQLAKFVVQSKWLTQNITEVHCVQNPSLSSCFSHYTLPGKTTQCKTKKIYLSILLFNKITQKLENSKTEIGIDCACVDVDP